MNPQSGTPRNDLERALIAGATDEAARPRFYETLLRSPVLVAPMGKMPPTVDGVVQAETELALSTIEIDGKPHVPFFSSEARLSVGTEFIGLSAVDFLRITKGSYLVLNPDSDHGKAFSPSEVDSLLDGSLFRPAETLTAKGGEQQFIGQPKDFPHKFAEAVSRFLSSEPTVEKAFLAQHCIAGLHAEPAILLAVIAPEAGFERIAGAIGIIATATRKAEAAVDITRLERSHLGYFADQAPIYERKIKKRSLFAKLFG